MKRASMIGLTFLLAASLVYPQSVTTLSPQKIPQTILDKMVSVYASCSSYVDQGKIVDIYGSQEDRTRTFTTAFVRPSKFRFEFDEDRFTGPSHYIVWRDGTTIQSWWTIKPQTITYETLAAALGTAAGVSGGSTVNVPSMLMGDLQDTHRISTMTELNLEREEKIGKRMAYRIAGRDWRHNLLTVWIDKESFLLLKIFQSKKLKSGPVVSTTTYEPQINIPVSPDKLTFKHL
jgi:hypothetical protein